MRGMGPDAGAAAPLPAGALSTDGEQLFRNLLERLPAAAYTCDCDGLITWFNARARVLWGREPRLNDPADRYCGSFRMFRRDGTPMAHADSWMALALRSGREFNSHDIVIERPDGHRVTALAHANPIRDEAGRVTGAVNVLIDITERIEAEERLKLVFGSIEDHLVIYDRQWRITFITDRGATLLGKAKEELLGRCIWDVLPDEVNNPYYFELNSAMTGQRVIRSEHYDSVRDRWFENHIHPTAEGVAVYAADITLRKRTERALRDSEALLRLAQHAAGAGVWDVDFASGISRWSAECHQLYGTDPASFVPTRAQWHALLHEEDRERVVAAGAAAIAQHQEFNCEFRITPPGRGTRWLWEIGRADYAADGTALRMSGLTIDITERKQAEVTQARLAAIVDSSQDAIFAKSLDGRIVSWNAGAERLYGYTAAEAIGRDVSMLIPPSRSEDERAILERASRGVPIEHYETVRVGKDGRPIDVSLSVSPVRDGSGRIVGVSKVSRDISARKRAERHLQLLLRASEKLNATLDVDELLDILALESASLVGAASGCAGLRSGETIGGRKYFHAGAELTLAGSWARGEGLAGWVLQHKTPYLTNDAAGDAQVDQALRTRYGVRNALATPLLATDGNVLGFVELHNKPGGFDDADRELLLAVTRVAAVALQNALIHRRVLERDEALRQADRRKDDFIAVLSHELRNPLAPISNGLEVLRTAPADPGLTRNVLQIMDRQVHHLVRLVDDLLEVSRITRGMIELKRQPVELASALRDAVEASRTLIDAGGHELAVDIESGSLVLNADPVRLAQIFANLLNNAAKYTPPGGRIRLDAQRDGEAVVVRVADNGIGLASSQIGSIFEMFTRGGRSLAGAQGGLGIGLTLARTLLAMHGGTIEAQSDGANRGSVFTVRLPLATPAEIDAFRPAAAAALAPVRARRVLAVDDNRDAADSLGILLQSIGVQPRIVYDGASALAAMHDERPDVVLLDISMPGMDGYEVAQQVRASGELCSIPLIALTGNGREQDRDRTHAAGFAHHLVKPVTSELLQAVLSAVDKRAADS